MTAPYWFTVPAMDERPPEARTGYAMRVVELSTSFEPGGIQRHVVALSEWLRARGHMVTLGGTEGAWGNRRVSKAFLPIRLDLVGGDGGGLTARVLATLRASVLLRRFLVTASIDIVHAHESAPLLVARIASIGLPVSIVVTYHGSERERVVGFARLCRFAAHRVLTPSRRSAADLVRAGLPAGKVEVAGLGIPEVPPLGAEDIADLRRSLLPDGRHFLAITVARLVPQKGIDFLIAVATRLAAEVHFVVVGDGPLRKSISKAAAGKGVDDRFTFVGHREDVHRYLAAADFFVLTSRWEALPLTIVEAMRAGLPVIAFDAGGVRELVDASVGWVHPIGDVDAVVRSIESLCRDDGLRLRLGRGARARSEEPRFSPDVVHAALEQVYVRLCAAARKSHEA
ncbi:MAG: glycosyltransferase family 4 protein [Casimicrobiaceae bacterium]